MEGLLLMTAAAVSALAPLLVAIPLFKHEQAHYELTLLGLERQAISIRAHDLNTAPWLPE